MLFKKTQRNKNRMKTRNSSLCVQTRECNNAFYMDSIHTNVDSGKAVGAEPAAQLFRASPPGPCRAGRPGSSPGMTIEFLSVHFTSYSISSVPYSVSLISPHYGH